MITKNWLARDILNGQTPTTASMAKFFQKLDSAIKISVDDDTVKQASNFGFKNYDLAAISTWNPLLATLTWIEGEISAEHLSFFADMNTMNIFSSDTVSSKVKFGLLVEMSENTKDYKLNWVNKASGILVNPLEGHLNFVGSTKDRVKWNVVKSSFFENDYWDLDIAKELLPIAEKSMIGVASLFFGIMAILGGQEISNWQHFSIIRN